MFVCVFDLVCVLYVVVQCTCTCTCGYKSAQAQDFAVTYTYMYKHSVSEGLILHVCCVCVSSVLLCSVGLPLSTALLGPTTETV